MIREAVLKDYEFIARKTEELRQGTFWDTIPYDFTADDIAKFMLNKVTQYGWVIFVDDDESECLENIRGFIGGNLELQQLPPYLLYVKEWTWWGEDNKSKTKLFVELESWAKRRGAVLSCYTKQNLQGQPEETLCWRKL